MMKRPGYLKEFLEVWTPRPRSARYGSACHSAMGDRLPEMLQPMSVGRPLPNARITKEFSQAGHAGGDDSAVRHTPSVPRTVSLRSPPKHCRGPENQMSPANSAGNPDCGSCGCAGPMAWQRGSAPSWAHASQLDHLQSLSQDGQARSKWAAQMPQSEKGLRVLP